MLLSDTNIHSKICCLCWHTLYIHVVFPFPHLGHFGQVLLHPLPPFPTRANELGTVVPSSFPLPSRVAVVRSIRDRLDLEPLELRPAPCGAGPLVATAAVGAGGGAVLAVAL